MKVKIFTFFTPEEEYVSEFYQQVEDLQKEVNDCLAIHKTATIQWLQSSEEKRTFFTAVITY